jgi:hypothetical protein
MNSESNGYSSKTGSPARDCKSDDDGHYHGFLVAASDAIDGKRADLDRLDPKNVPVWPL